MQTATKAELQMLRELAWVVLPHLSCTFCKSPLLTRLPNITFGHRHHPPIEVKFTSHHLRHDRTLNNIFGITVVSLPSHTGNTLYELAGDIRLAHKTCHTRYHANLRRKNEPELDERSTEE